MEITNEAGITILVATPTVDKKAWFKAFQGVDVDLRPEKIAILAKINKKLQIGLNVLSVHAVRLSDLKKAP